MAKAKSIAQLKKEYNAVKKKTGIGAGKSKPSKNSKSVSKGASKSSGSSGS